MRLVGFILLFILSTLVQPLILLPLAVFHAFIWRAYELLIISVFIDAYFGVSYTVPYYTLSTLVMLLTIEWLKPHLSFYTENQ